MLYVSDDINKDSKSLKNSTLDVGYYRQIYKSGNIFFDSPHIYIFKDYYGFLRANSDYIELDQRYFQKPETLSMEIYETIKLWEMLLYVNNVFCIEDFTMDKIYLPKYDAVFEMMRRYIKDSDRVTTLSDIDWSKLELI
jgi:hypothetical protein